MEQQMSVSEPVTAQFSDTTHVANAVLTAVADATDTRIDELPPLYDVVDSDALNDIFEPRLQGASRASVRLTFTFADCHIAVHDGTVTVTNSAEPTNEKSAPRAVREHSLPTSTPDTGSVDGQ